MRQSVEKDGAVNTILLVDDDYALRNMLKRVLTGAGYDVHAAGSGEEAALVYAQYYPDLVITDLIMPDGEGLQLMMRLRRLDEQAKIIAMTGGGRGGKRTYLFMARELGADYTIEKPFSIEEFLSIVRLAIKTEPASPSIAIA
jgi:DNA-binding response OmpR family regulator